MNAFTPIRIALRIFRRLRRRWRKFFRPVRRAARRRFNIWASRNNLRKLAILFGTDKENCHFYTQHYQRHFHSLRKKKLSILEIGVGGYELPREGGNSLRMWKTYFRKANIFGIDLHDKSFHDEPRIKTFQGSQVDEDFLRKLMAKIGPVDIIIDDGSHMNEHVIESFKILFPLLAPNGIYAVEDLQTSYWDQINGTNWGGSSDLSAPHTSMNFFKSLADGLNYEEFTQRDERPGYFDRHVISVHFYHNMVFVYKGLNDEGSNFLGPSQNEVPSE